MQTNPGKRRTTDADDPLDAAIDARLRRHVMEHAVPAEHSVAAAPLNVIERVGIGFLMLIARLLTAIDRKQRFL